MVDLSVLADDPYPAIALVMGGLLSLFVAVYGKHDDSHLDELATYVGFILGAVMIVMAIIVAIEETVNWFTMVMMILLAMTLFLKPLKDFPLAAIVGVIAGAVVTYIISLFLSSPVLGVEEWKILAVIFFVVTFIVWLVFHFIEDLMKLTRMILDWRPVMVIVGLVAMIEGVLLFLDSSLVSLF
jgi:uncharacterized protein YacL